MVQLHVLEPGKKVRKTVENQGVEPMYTVDTSDLCQLKGDMGNGALAGG